MGTLRGRWPCLVLAAGLATAGQALAGLSVQGTRAVLLEREGEALVRVDNAGDSPVLAQAWIDDGTAVAEGPALRLPLMLSPPVARIDQGRGQVLRILQVEGGLPPDRESLFWLNVLEIPQRPAAAEGQAPGNALQFAFRTRIKLFYRPKALREPPERAAEHLEMALQSDGGRWALRATNRSAYHLSFRELVLRRQAFAPVLAHLAASADRMVGPGQTVLLPLTMAAEGPADLATTPARVFFTLIDDHGGDRHGERALDALAPARH